MLSKKSILIFIFGCIVGFSVFLIIGTINVYRHKGRDLFYPAVFGDVRIIPMELDPKIALDTYKKIAIRKNDEIFLLLSFDEQNKLQELSYVDDGSQLFMADLSLSKKGGIEYGRMMRSSLYWDIDCDGVFDVQWIDGTPKTPTIFVDGHWIKVDAFKRNEKKAILKQDNQETVYIFESGKGWIKQKE